MNFSHGDVSNLERWQYKVVDKSLLSAMFQPFWNFLTTLFPVYVHPNLISLAGFLCSSYAYILTYRFAPSKLLAIAVVALSSLYTTLDCIDGKQARRTKTSSVVGELFDHALDNIGASMLMLSGYNLWEITDPFIINTSNYSINLIFMIYHVHAFISPTKTIIFGRFSGQTEAMVLFGAFCLASIKKEAVLETLTEDQLIYLKYFPVVVCVILYIYYILLMFLMYLSKDSPGTGFSANNNKIINIDKHGIEDLSYNMKGYTLAGVILLYAIRIMGTLNLPSPEIAFPGTCFFPTQLGYIADGVVLSMATTEIILCKMSYRPFNPIVVILAMISLMDHVLALIVSGSYYCVLFYDLSKKLKIPMFHVNTRVYCCGVFDMCHRGHMILFERAAKFGDELLVGVHNDEDVASYKRTPNICHEERCETVAVCKNVSQVIPNAPLLVTKSFIEEHRIDVVVCSPEYDKQDDHYYQAAREMGILSVLPRTEGVSSSDMMRIIMERNKNGQNKNIQKF